MDGWIWIHDILDIRIFYYLLLYTTNLLLLYERSHNLPRTSDPIPDNFNSIRVHTHQMNNERERNKIPPIHGITQPYEQITNQILIIITKPGQSQSLRAPLQNQNRIVGTTR